MNAGGSHRNDENAMDPVRRHRNYDSPRPVRRLVEAHGGQSVDGGLVLQPFSWEILIFRLEIPGRSRQPCPSYRLAYGCPPLKWRFMEDSHQAVFELLAGAEAFSRSPEERNETEHLSISPKRAMSLWAYR
jgi:hypothetical protein